jgi:organic hydroperoxide reductase OsmC/OhrA
MAHHTAEISWLRGTQDFVGNRYRRKHLLRFDGGIEIAGSSSSHVVPLPMSDACAVDPEEMFVASIASCHMLWFLSIAAKYNFCVDRYDDKPVGIMQRNKDGKMAMTKVTLKPSVQFSGTEIPSYDQLNKMHHEAHAECFIANSVTTDVCCEPVYA